MAIEESFEAYVARKVAENAAIARERAAEFKARRSAAGKPSRRSFAPASSA